MSEAKDQSTSGGPLYTLADSEAEYIQSACDKFRILIMGRANAGKTTILQRLCNTTEDPVVYDVQGKEVGLR